MLGGWLPPACSNLCSYVGFLLLAGLSVRVLAERSASFHDWCDDACSFFGVASPVGGACVGLVVRPVLIDGDHVVCNERFRVGGAGAG